MALKDDLALFAALVGGLGTDAPDDYPEWSSRNYESERQEVEELWNRISVRLERDSDKVPFVAKKLSEAFCAFDAGDKIGGRKSLWDIYNLGIKQLR